MIFQFYHLLPELTTLENVLAPLMITHGVWSYWRSGGNSGPWPPISWPWWGWTIG